MDKRSVGAKQLGWLSTILAIMTAIAASVFFHWPVRHRAPLELPRTVVIAEQPDRSSSIVSVPGGEKATKADGVDGRVALGSTENPSGGSIDRQLEITPYDRLLEVALDNPDPSVRLGGIEAAIRERSEETFDLLWEAVQLDPDPDNRLSAVSELEQMLKRDLFDGESILQLLNETAQDTDPRVAELSSLIIQEHLGEQEPIAVTEELPVSDEIDSWQSDLNNTESDDFGALPGISIEALWQLALLDPDPAVRLGGIEAAMGRPDVESFDLIVQAALYDSDPDNRLSAVGVLENRSTSGFDDGDEMLYVLEKTSVDPDPRIAALSALVIEEYIRARAERSRSEHMLAMEEKARGIDEDAGLIK